MLPFYIYYSMFGFQRVGDLIWAAADQRARGFLLGATAGRTTLGGEGLQHQDGSQPRRGRDRAELPRLRSAFAGELAVILDHGMREMLERQEDVFYYVTVMNENYRAAVAAGGSEADIVARHVSLARARREGDARTVRCSARDDPARGDRGRRAARRENGAWRARSSASPASASSRARRARSSAGTACIPARATARATSQRLLDGQRADDRGDRLRARLSAAHRRVCRCGLHGARHRRLRPQRHARRAAALLRGRPPHIVVAALHALARARSGPRATLWRTRSSATASTATLRRLGRR